MLHLSALKKRNKIINFAFNHDFEILSFFFQKNFLIIKTINMIRITNSLQVRYDI